jgi:hypothetical protein
MLMKFVSIVQTSCKIIELTTYYCCIIKRRKYIMVCHTLRKPNSLMYHLIKEIKMNHLSTTAQWNQNTLNYKEG